MGQTTRVDSDLPAYELIQRIRSESQPFQAPEEPDDELDKPTTRLPPKPLPGRRKYRPFVVATLIAVFTIVPLTVLIKCIQYMMPDLYYTGVELDGLSCDLISTQNSSRMQSAFQINLRGAAHLSFAEAKFIDLVFDLVVGQGGRLLLGTISYVVFMDALLRFMEITPVPYNLYTSMVFSSTSFIATWRSTKAVVTTRGWRAKVYLVWCSLAMIYVLAFPTLIESATGYVQPSSAGFSFRNGTVIMADSDELLSCYNVSGGALIGLTNNTIAPGPPAHVFDALTYGDYGLSDNPVPPGVNTDSLYYTLLSCSLTP